VLPNLPQANHPNKASSRPLIQANGGWVPLPEIMALGIAQYNTRPHELRRMGFRIENKLETEDDGMKHSWYRLLNGMSELSKESKPSPATPAPRDSSDWYENSTEKKRPAVAQESPYLWDRHR
jgi:hypothetical protein